MEYIMETIIIRFGDIVCQSIADVDPIRLLHHENPSIESLLLNLEQKVPWQLLLDWETSVEQWRKFLLFRPSANSLLDIHAYRFIQADIGVIRRLDKRPKNLH